MKKPEAHYGIRFKQIAAAGNLIYGLDKSGSVWWFCRIENAWFLLLDRYYRASGEMRLGK